MIGRLLKLFVLIAVAYGLIRWLFTSRQKIQLHEGAKTLAQALVISGLLAVVWHLAGGHR
ncbi:protein MIGRI [Crenobacter cavernae]|uniref:Uncharacterized protein n=1 Tax=Crenobacter cavernae TaxID=2290923 RepID=A0ABY0FC95_9NEIS|nr:hypothetical protein [Crenobacter cavernae]RXZ43713.1 hypothetical protein EBB06_08885 [Crenobacter cavernae]